MKRDDQRTFRAPHHGRMRTYVWEDDRIKRYDEPTYTHAHVARWWSARDGLARFRGWWWRRTQW